MSAVVGPLELPGSDMCVDLGATQRPVSKEFLHGSEIGSLVEQMSGKSVTESVGTLSHEWTYFC